MIQNKPIIEKVSGREVIDSRGNPTVEATVILTDGSVGKASVPSGASTGIYEAHEKRDGDIGRYGGKGVLEAVGGIGSEISPALAGMNASKQYEIDRVMRELDGTAEKKRLGANALLAVSLATCRATAAFYGQPVWQYLGGARACRLPVPMFNILNGGAHASNNVDIQEFMIMPVGAPSFSEALRIGCEIYHTLGKILKKSGLSTAVGDEGGYAPNLESDTAALDLICQAITDAGYSFDTVRIALDVAASEWYSESESLYRCPKSGKSYDTEELIALWESLSARYPIYSIEDGLDQRDFVGWSKMTERLGSRIMLVGDDFFVTNPERVKKGITEGAANAVLVKPNQIGTLSETMQVCEMAAASGYNTIMSHRSGETEDSTLADLAVALGAPFIKSGAPCRSERLAKYNRLLAIESCLGAAAKYGTARVKMNPKGAVKV
jgi:enolase